MSSEVSKGRVWYKPQRELIAHSQGKHEQLCVKRMIGKPLLLFYRCFLKCMQAPTAMAVKLENDRSRTLVVLLMLGIDLMHAESAIYH